MLFISMQYSSIYTTKKGAEAPLLLYFIKFSINHLVT
jgi:hypothetical protein